ncbi:glutamine amidotransferase subunit pdxT [Mycobacterium kansasii]|uniref:Glutamine amidotransferase subunit pdxT n=1 Tax=Mycobacterium kansasii TaxID=1768 RepID=A0A1V3W959_MYCKA|nr:glutamine amidotransferase subunit pdxT [Mycobacterium kansasii]
MPVRRRDELDAVDALVLPAASRRPSAICCATSNCWRRCGRGCPMASAYGACAGMILLASEILDAGARGREAVPLRGIDMTVRRNAFGAKSIRLRAISRSPPGRPGACGVHQGAMGRAAGEGVQVLPGRGHIVAVRQARCGDGVPPGDHRRSSYPSAVRRHRPGSALTSHRGAFMCAPSSSL